MNNDRGKLIDFSGSTGYYVDSPAGEYGVLFGTSSTRVTAGATGGVFNGETLGDNTTMPAVGLIYYQAGVAVISGSLFNDATNGGVLADHLGTLSMGNAASGLGVATGFQSITGSTLDTFTSGITSRIFNISYNNTGIINIFNSANQSFKFTTNYFDLILYIIDISLSISFC